MINDSKKQESGDRIYPLCISANNVIMLILNLRTILYIRENIIMGKIRIIRSYAVKALNSVGMLRMQGFGLWFIIAIFIMGLSGVASAAPSITDWSSSVRNFYL